MTIATDKLDLSAVPTPAEGEDQRVLHVSATFPDLADDGAFETVTGQHLTALVQALVGIGIPAAGIHLQMAETDIEVTSQTLDGTTILASAL